MSTLRGRPAGAILIFTGIVYVILLAAALIWLHLSPEIVLALILGGIGIPLLCLRPYIGLHFFLFMFYLESALAEGVLAMKVVGVVILTGWLLNVAVRRSARLELHPLIFVIAIFVVWCGVTALFAEDSRASILATFSFAQLMVATLMFSSVLDSTSRIRALYGAIVLWGSIVTLIALAMYYLGITPVAQGFTHNRNLLAMHINIAIVAAYVLFQTSRSPAAKGVLLATFPVFFLGLALTLSRTGLVALALTFALLMLRLARERGFLVIGSTLAALCLVSFVLPDAFWTRASSILPSIERQEGTFGLRVKIWKVGLEMMQDHPLTGVGAGNFLNSFGQYAHGRFLWRHLSPHNAFVGVGSQMGIVGLALFILLLLIALGTASRSIRSGALAGRHDIRSLAVVVEVCILGFIVGLFTGDGETSKLLWILFGVTLSLSRLGREALESRRLAEAAPPPAPAPIIEPGWQLIR